MGVRNRHSWSRFCGGMFRSNKLTTVCSLSSLSPIQFNTQLCAFGWRYSIENMPGIVNRNPALYGPGPLARKPGGLGAGPPLRGLVITAMQGIAFGLVGGFGYKFFIGDPGIQAIEDYYKENPTR